MKLMLHRDPEHDPQAHEKPNSGKETSELSMWVGPGKIWQIFSTNAKNSLLAAFKRGLNRLFQQFKTSCQEPSSQQINNLQNTHFLYFLCSAYDDLLFLLLFSLVKNAEYLQQAALEEYGPDLHMALRSRRDELLYLRKLTEMLFPYILPPKGTDCR